MNLQISNKFVAKSKYYGGSKFDFWKKIQPGDILEVSLDLVDPGCGRHRYATMLTVCKNESKTFRCTLTELCNYLSKITLLDA